MKNKAFTLIELIFTIVIIGVLASVAIPKFAGLSENSKITSELSTASSIQVAIDSCHGEWIINEGSFTCGKSIDGQNDLTDEGYPKKSTLLTKLLGNLIDWSSDDNISYKGPASNSNSGTSKCKDNKPCIGKHWDYNETTGSFTLTS